MWNDPIVNDVRKIREDYGRKFGFDLARIVADLRKSEQSRLRSAKKVKPKKRPARNPKRRRAA